MPIIVHLCFPSVILTVCSARGIQTGLQGPTGGCKGVTWGPWKSLEKNCKHK